MTYTKRTTRSMTRSKATASAARAERRLEKPAVSLLEHLKRITGLKGVAKIICKAQRDKGAVGNAQRVIY